MKGYALKDVYLDAHKQLRNLKAAGQLSADDFQIITAKAQPDDLRTLVNDAIHRSSAADAKRAQDIVHRLVIFLKRFENALDMIVQSLPQIMGLSLAGLIWGGLKFVLVVSQQVGHMVLRWRSSRHRLLETCSTP